MSLSSSSAVVEESLIRKMTRLAIEHEAINLSQGYPNEGPPMSMRMAVAHAVLTGQEEEVATDIQPNDDDDNSTRSTDKEDSLRTSLLNLLSKQQQQQEQLNDCTSSLHDTLNQYSIPCGRFDVRQAIAEYYHRFYGYDEVSPDTNITVTLGATEAYASALRTLGQPGDKCVVFEPFHEMYPNQCAIFYLQPVYVTLRNNNNNNNNNGNNNNNNNNNNNWHFDTDELEQALSQSKILMLNTPHNPTGKVFTYQELQIIVDLCVKYNVYIVTDEIYEHMAYSGGGCSDNDNENDDNHRHYCIPRQFPQIAQQTLICNSLGKSASATGWRVGWCITPSHLTETYRAIHDQLTVMSPHPMQYATLQYLKHLKHDYFTNLKHKYQRRVTKLANALQQCGFYNVIHPQGAYYLFVQYKPTQSQEQSQLQSSQHPNNMSILQSMSSSMEAAMYLLTKVGVACVPGDNFYGKSNNGQYYLRFAACRSDSDIDQACDRLLRHFTSTSSTTSTT